MNQLAKNKKTAAEAILGTLKRGPKRGLTAAQIAERVGLPYTTVSRTLSELSGVTVLGTLQTGQRGRPANIYGYAA